MARGQPVDVAPGDALAAISAPIAVPGRGPTIWLRLSLHKFTHFIFVLPDNLAQVSGAG